MDELKDRARELLTEFKGNAYAFGPGAIVEAGRMVARMGDRVLLARSDSAHANGMLDGLQHALDRAGIEIASTVHGAAVNTPVQDVERVRADILRARPDAVVALGGSSLIDGVKASAVLAALEGSCEDYYGTGKVSEAAARAGRSPVPVMAVQTVAGSAAHLTPSANVTDLSTMQKRVIADEACVPPLAIFDYNATLTCGPELTKAGAFDGICHLVEVYLGLRESDPHYERAEEVCLTGLELLVAALPGVVKLPGCEKCRETVGLGTDLGGYALTLGSTNGPHLNSFSLVDVMDHGRAAAVLLPYYVCMFAPAVAPKLVRVGSIYQEYGCIDTEDELETMEPIELGRTVALGMAELTRQVGFPVSLGEVAGVTDVHVERMLKMAKDPTLAGKMAAMPVPLVGEDVDRCMGSVIVAALAGDLDLVETVDQ